jgi:hypothetical protein
MMTNSHSFFWRTFNEFDKQKQEMLKLKFSHEKGDYFFYLNIYRALENQSIPYKKEFCRNNYMNYTPFKHVFESVREISQSTNKF